MRSCELPKEGGFTWCWLVSGILLSLATPGGKDPIHTPNWHGSITLSSPSHAQHTENASNSSQDNREICWELNTPTYLCRNRMPRNRHFQQITQSANYVQGVPVSTPQTHYLAGAALQWRGWGNSKTNLEECEKLTGLWKSKVGEGSRLPRWWTGRAGEETAESKLADTPNNFTQFRHTQSHKHSCVYTNSNIWRFTSFCGKYSQLLGKPHSSLAFLGEQGVSFMQECLRSVLLFISLSSLSNCDLTTLSSTKSGREKNNSVVPSEGHSSH